MLKAIAAETELLAFADEAKTASPFITHAVNTLLGRDHSERWVYFPHTIEVKLNGFPDLLFDFDLGCTAHQTVTRCQAIFS